MSLRNGYGQESTEEKIDRVLRKNADALNLVQIPRTPLQELLSAEGADAADGGGEEESEAALAAREERWEEKLAVFRKLLEFFFQSGPDPLRVLRNVFAVTKAVRPELIGDMSLDDIAIICADGGKATVSARIERVFNGTLKKAGHAEGKAAFQKRSGRYAEAQRGNKNRKGGGRAKGTNRRGAEVAEESRRKREQP